MSTWTRGRQNAVRIVVTATGADGSVTCWYSDVREGREPQTIALPPIPGPSRSSAPDASGSTSGDSAPAADPDNQGGAAT